jgi:hypothetical protein
MICKLMAITVNLAIINNTAAAGSTSAAPGTSVPQPALQAVEVFPNPANRSTTLAFTSGQPEEIDMVITDSLVQEVMRIRSRARTGLNTLFILTLGLRPGSCTINVGNKLVKKLIVG